MWMIDVEEFLTLRDLFNEELSISEITRQTGHSRVTVRKYLSSQVPPLPQKRSRKPSKLDGHREYIIDRLKEYLLSPSCIYREIRDRGFTGKYTIVKDFVCV
jgi:transposase